MKRQPRKSDNQKAFKELLNNIRPLAIQIVKLKCDMKKLGMHTGDYDLIECPKCRLAEDVLADNRLVTFFNLNVKDFKKVQYTKLKFMELKDNLFLCPNCGNIIKAKEL
jgi:ssDNA-binding Zn-finger/Zn-ribbon topoisomerase 1